MVFDQICQCYVLKGVGWVHGLDEQGIWIRTDHGTLLIWILNSHCFRPWWCDLGLIKHIVLGRVGGAIDIL